MREGRASRTAEQNVHGSPDAGIPDVALHVRGQGLEKVRDDHLGSLSVEGVALAKCAAEQFLLRAGAPDEGRDNPGQHDHEGRPSAAITAVCGTGNTRSAQMRAMPMAHAQVSYFRSVSTASLASWGVGIV